MAGEETVNGWSEVIKVLEGVSSANSLITTTLIGLLSGVTDLKKNVSDLSADVARLRFDLTSVRTDVMARMDRLQDKIEAVTDDLTVNYASSVKSERLARNSLDEVRTLSDQVTAMQIQLRRVTAKVFGPDDLH